MSNSTFSDIAKPTEPRAVTLESWAQGYMVGSLVIMAGEFSIRDKKEIPAKY
jgi:hypothetical protein